MGRVAKQQNTGPLHIPLNNWCDGIRLQSKGIATSVGHAPVSALIDPVALEIPLPALTTSPLLFQTT